MSNLFTALMMSTVVGLSQSVNLQPQTIQTIDPEQIQSCQSRDIRVSLDCYELKVAHHNNEGEDPSDKAPKPGDGRREN